MVSFFKSLASWISQALVFLSTLPGLIVSAVLGFTAFITDIFSQIAIFSPISTLLSNLSNTVNSLVSYANGFVGVSATATTFSDYIGYIVAFDSFVSDLVIVFTLTFGVIGLVFFSFVVSISSLLFLFLIVRSVQKVVSIFTAGYVHT